MITHSKLARSRGQQTGGTLIEVLVSILIFGIGMLGMLGLMTASAKYQSGTVVRGQIAEAIEVLGERIRSNVAVANGRWYVDPVTNVATLGNAYTYSDTYTNQVASRLPWPPTSTPNCQQVACTQQQRATYDMLDWRAQIQRSMPGGSVIVAGNVASGFDVTVMWFDKTAVQGDDAQFLDTLLSNQECPANVDLTTPAARFCCPAVAGAPDGVRCYNAKIIP